MGATAVTSFDPGSGRKATPPHNHAGEHQIRYLPQAHYAPGNRRTHLHGLFFH
ncbi:MAG: hypothetical protein ACLS7Q_06065 [Varibaculum cambriense]